jgi:hypothetical protein
VLVPADAEIIGETDVLILTGYVTAFGALQNVMITGALDVEESHLGLTHGNIAFWPTGRLIIELGGTTAGTEHDWLISAGSVSLDCTLEVRLVNGFVPEMGQRFTIIRAIEGIQGDFYQIVTPLPRFWYFERHYDGLDMELEIRTTHPWHNSRRPLDVTDDGAIVAGDVVQVINYINAFGAGPVPDRTTYVSPFLDTSGDNSVTAIDALNIINHINGFGAGPAPAGEGESAAAATRMMQAASAANDPLADLIAILAGDIASSSPRRRR